MVETVKKRSVLPIVGLVILLVGVAAFIVGVIMWKVGGVDQYLKTESFSIKNQPMDGINNLEISIGAAELIVNKGGEKLEVIGENLPENEYAYGTQEGKFYIKRKNFVNFIFPSIVGLLTDKNTDPKVTITVPDKLYNKVNIDIGAGKATVEGLTASDVDFNIGAGELNAKDMKVIEKLDIDVGTGKSSFENFDCNKVKIDSGVGKLDFSGSVYGGLEADCGIGQVDITLFGLSSDYDIDAESGIGNVNINRNSSGRGSIPVDIEGGIGEVNLTFKENK